MPLTAKGKKLKKKFKEQYGKKKGEKVFYAMESSGKLKKVIKARGGDAAKSDAASGRSAGRADPSGGVDRSAVGAGSQYSRNKAKAALDAQRKKAIASISPSTTPAGIAARTIGTLAFGIPQSLTARAIDYSPLAFGVPKSTKPKGTTTDQENKNDRGGGLQKTITPTVIEATKPVDPNLVSPKENFFNFVAYKVGGLSGGVSYGPPPKKGPSSQGLKNKGRKK